jgi:Serine aminopeptidase, S33
MSWPMSLFVKPLYRVIYGRPAGALAAASGRDRNGEADSRRGLVVMADGVGGLDLCGTGLAYVLGAAKLPYAISVVPWSHGLGRWLADLTDVGNCRTHADSVATIVRSFKAAQPDDPIFLVAKSGGSGVAIKALEALEPNTVERVVLLAPALSPQYDLTRALRAVRHELVVFWSPFDVVILGAGTRLFGTIDRVKTVAAGLVGFTPPPTAKRSDLQSTEYEKLCQVRWRAPMAATGYFGGHFGPDSPLFLRKYVVPLLQTEDSDYC